MRVYEIYDQLIKTLPADDRLRLAKLIIDYLAGNDITSNLPISDRPGDIRDQIHLEQHLLAGLNSGPGIEATPEYWENKRKTLIEHYNARVRTSNMLSTLSSDLRHGFFAPTYSLSAKKHVGMPF